MGRGDLQRRERKTADGEILPGGRDPAVCQVGPAGGRAMTDQTYRLGEFRAFEGGGRRFLYLVPSAGIFELDEPSSAVLERLEQGEATGVELAAIAGDEDVVEELYQSRAIVAEKLTQPLQEPP